MPRRNRTFLPANSRAHGSGFVMLLAMFSFMSSSLLPAGASEKSLSPSFASDSNKASSSDSATSLENAQPGSASENLELVTRSRRIVNSVGHAGWEPLETSVLVFDNRRLVFIDEQGNHLSESALKRLQENFTAPELSERKYPVGYDEVAVLLELDCQAAIQRIFRRGNRYILIQSFTFRNSLGAYAAYNFLRKGSTNVITRGDGSSEDAQTISFWQDNQFFRLIGTSEEDEESKDVSATIAEQLSNLVGRRSDLPPIVSALPVIDRVKGSEKAVLGPLLARRYMPLPYLVELSLESSNGAALADYQMQFPHRERLKLMLIDYPSPHIADQAFGSFQEKLSGLHKPQRRESGASSQFLFKMGSTYLYCERRGRNRLLIIYGARKPNSSATLARQFY